MRRLLRPALLLSLVAAFTLHALADKAKDLYGKGQDAEARQNYEAAYGFFKQAYDLKPKDLRYRTAFERVRFEAAAQIVHRGQKLRDDVPKAGLAAKVHGRTVFEIAGELLALARAKPGDPHPRLSSRRVR